ncbi:proton-conducting transporter membrane subunit [Methanoregula sp.]|uniref:proton-conducting transporter transmembrane domain-containing protein n=1 Tax=Methanoregula sp. TaxID=2052170 RepID=UPI0026076229|nr:proton-conducting transporter membrane subunit [Methanoregula sp.]MDD5142117.1 proton-conducting transporter membrane subunit [Methanoregula sp.]
MIAGLFIISLGIFVLGVLLPLAGTWQDRRIFRAGSHLCTIAGSILLGALSLFLFLTGNDIAWTAYQPVAGFSLSFVIDRLSAFFLLLISVVSICVALYAAEYNEHLEGGLRRNLLSGCTNLFILSMVLVVASANTFSFLVFWELMAGCSFLLVMYDYSRATTRKAGLFYFVMTHLSTLFVLLGIVLLFSSTGSFVLAPAGVSPVSAIAFVALLIGFSIKAGIIPFHKWLPYAHPASPTPISALMSSVMLKIAVYGLLRFLLDVFSPDVWWGILILIMGTTTAVLGIIYALKEYDIKAMLAYSSIENTGIIFMGIGLYVIFSSYQLFDLALISLLSALFHTLNHAIFKSLLFLTAGSVVHATHTRDIEQMGGLIHRMPYTAGLFFVGALAIAALPPLNGFASEVLLFISFFSSIAVADPLFKVLLFLCLGLFALTSALSAACFVKAFGSVFLALPRSPESGRAEEVPFLMLLGPALLASACIVLGLFAAQIFFIAGFTVPMPDMFLVGLLLLAMLVLTFAVLFFTASRDVRVTDTWGCGTLSQQPAMEYSGHGFSEPIDIIFSTVYRTKMKNERTFFDQKNCIFAEGKAEIRLIKVFEEYLYLPVARASYATAETVSRFQSGCLDTYLLYVFCAVIAVIVFLGWLA